ncbi:MAG: amidohydrolase family protein [Deltaproteobacteria bacterium]|nr:amidohydrolase family protein [Deltaproteobacteria bacterium]
MKARRIGWVIALVLLMSLMGCRSDGTPPGQGRFTQTANQDAQTGGPSFIDAHNHLVGFNRPGKDYLTAARVALKKMDQLGILKMVIMPPPRVPDQPGSFDVSDLIPVVKRYPNRFACLGGGGTLNVMIHENKTRRTIGADTKRKFEKMALNILSRGAIGFGELSVEHFSLNWDHPYESAPADHPLFLMLADLAARHHVPLDIHMEAIPQDMPLPKRNLLLRSGRNPAMLHENLSAFERLLDHNREAKIIWAHVGWCNTGYRTPALCRKLLQKHPNLFMTIKLSPESVPATRILTKDQKSIKPAWLTLFQDYPDRFLIGTDQFYVPPGSRRIGPQKTSTTRQLMNLLPPGLARKIGIENPRHVLNLK